MNEIREGLKRKWNEVNHEYQKLTHVKLVDTVGLKARKEYEKWSSPSNGGQTDIFRQSW